jgi:two-component system OmpR family response regulator
VVSDFGWTAEGLKPPPQRWDLRRAGWTLSPGLPALGQVCLIDMRDRQPGGDMAGLAGGADPARCLFMGVDTGPERARLIASGGGEALSSGVRLAELAQRALRVAATRESLPRQREVDRLTLDLLHRDARFGPEWLSLHPREFELLWRLAQQPGQRVSRASLLSDVWRLDFEPGTNSVEVHVSRLRTKLATVGLAALIETDPEGGYRLGQPRAAAGARSADPLDLRLCA